MFGWQKGSPTFVRYQLQQESKILRVMETSWKQLPITVGRLELTNALTCTKKDGPPHPFLVEACLHAFHVGTVATRRFCSQFCSARIRFASSNQQPIFGVKTETFDPSPTLWRTQWDCKETRPSKRIWLKEIIPASETSPPIHYLSLFPFSDFF